MRHRFPYLLIPLLWSPAWADQASSPLDREIRAHFQEMMGRVNDPARNLAERQRLVLEAVATLDRAAQAFKDPEDRREIWFQAARTLDTFNRQNPHHDRLADLSLQAATYEWAASFSLSEQALLTPTDARLRERAIRELEAVAQRFRDVIKSSPTEVQRQTARYRLAVVLSDRGRLEVQDDAARRKWESEALELVGGRFEPAALDSYARILRAELLNRLDRPGEALDVIDPGDERFGQPAALRIRAESLAAVGRSEEALDLLTSPPFEPAARAAAIASVRLIQVKRALVGSSRSLAEEDLFRQARSLQGPEARRVRLALARTLVEPGPDRLPEDWQLLAEGRAIAGDLVSAVRLLQAGARRAEALSNHEQACRLQLEAASDLLQLGQVDDALESLRQLATDSRAGATQARAALLRAVTLVRLGQRTQGRRALEDLLSTFSTNPVVDEAHWELARLADLRGDLEEAIHHLEGIRIESPRWLESRLEIVALTLRRIEDPDRTPIRLARRELDSLRTFLGKARDEVRDSTQIVPLELARLRLELSPRGGEDPAARSLIEKLQRFPMTPHDREMLTGLEAISSALSGHYAEAERQTLTWVGDATPAARLAVAEFLDRAAELAESDLARRRFGNLGGMVLKDLRDQLPASQGFHLDLLTIRALAAQGDTRAATVALGRLDRPKDQLEPAALQVLAETERDLGANAAALHSYELVTQRTPAGSPVWLMARLGQARTYRNQGDRRTALQVIETTKLLYPELGGAALKARFEELRGQITGGR